MEFFNNPNLIIMKSFFTKLFLVAFISMTAFSCVKAAIEDSLEDLEKDLNDDSKTELVEVEE